MGEENLSGLIPTMLAGIFLSVLYVVGLWKIYVKAGQAGWKSIIPIYNLYILLKIIGRPGWWLILFFIPIANIVIPLVVAMDLAKVFNKSKVFGIVLLWLFSFIGYLMLGFGKATYTPPTAAQIPSSPAIPPTPSAPPPQPTQA